MYFKTSEESFCQHTKQISLLVSKILNLFHMNTPLLRLNRLSTLVVKLKMPKTIYSRGVWVEYFYGLEEIIVGNLASEHLKHSGCVLDDLQLLYDNRFPELMT